ncbi:MAG: leucine-rich repeat domain-containing protein, partial [Prevotellaceae bacterium]|nr:leucine-rich repeat domain-containing protein [Prevotellaceae bacterium]
MKKTILLLIIAFSLCTINKAMAQEASGTTGDCTWELTGTSGEYTLTVSGSGAMGDYSYDYIANITNTPWWDYKDNIKTVIIEDGVTTIGIYSFYQFENLETVTIGENVETIGDYAFYGCHSLTSAVIGENVTAIGRSAFYMCHSLTGALIIPGLVMSIGDWTFYGCRNLTSVTIGNSVTTIGERAFYNCTGLISVIIGNSVTSIEELAFYNCTGLTNVYIKRQSPPWLGDNVFLDIPTNSALHIPCVAKDAYQGATGWKDFTYYIEDVPLTGTTG